MDVNFTAQRQKNLLNYNRALERIIEKYSKLEYQDGGIEVDLNDTSIENLHNLPDLSDVSLKCDNQDMTRNSQLDLTLQDDGANERCVSIVSTHFSSEDGDGLVARSDTSQLTGSLLDESSHNSSLTGLQPEDVDDELDMTFRSRGSLLADLYPGMVDRLQQAWSRHHTAEAADLVLRRYRRWRQQPSRSTFNNSLYPQLRHVHHKKIGRREHLGRSGSPSRTVTLQQSRSAVARSPGGVRRQPPQPVFVMDLSGVSETCNSSELSLNETFDVPKRRRPSTFDFSPLRCRKSPDLSLRSKRLPLSASSVRADGSCIYVPDRPESCRSPVRQSPLRTKAAMILSKMQPAFSRSPGGSRFSREPKRRRSMSESLTSATNMPLRVFCSQDSQLSLQSQPSSLRSASASGPRHFRRHLSFDSSMSEGSFSWSAEQLDDEFIKLYHRFVCQNKPSFLHGLPCRFCARSSEVRGHSSSSSSLAALALSPHRSLLRKRHRELSWVSNPQSKRLRDEYYTSSPGSKRHVKEMLRRRLSTLEPEQSCDGTYFSPRSSNLLSRFKNQLQEHQETQMSPSSRMFH